MNKSEKQTHLRREPHSFLGGEGLVKMKGSHTLQTNWDKNSEVVDSKSQS